MAGIVIGVVIMRSLHCCSEWQETVTVQCGAGFHTQARSEKWLSVAVGVGAHEV